MTYESPLLSRSNIRAWLAPVAALVFLLSLLVAVLVVARITRDEALPPDPGPFVLPRAAVPTLSYDVERADGDVLKVAQGQDTARVEAEISIPESATIDFLEVVDPSEIEVGDWVTVIGVKNEVRNFAIRMIVLIEGGGTADEDGWLRTPAGFVGYEAARESRETAILAGEVVTIAGEEVVVDSGEGITLNLRPGAPLRRVRAGTPDEIQDGDRIALHEAAPGEGDPAAGVLVLVGGAR